EMDRYSQFQQLSKSLVESASDLKDLKGTLKDKTRDIETLLLQQARVNTELQEGLMRTRTVPLSRAIVPRLRRTIRQVSGELDKPVTFDIGNSDGELDRSVIERMVAPLEHVIRNAIDHGIESVAARKKAGKSETGSIRLDIHREGSDVVIKLSDDGKGVDVAAVKKKAIALGLMQKNEQLPDDEIKQFIMSAGFSTAAKVTQISGRGVGMDVVQKEIQELGGTLELVSEKGKGTAFIFRLPFTVSMNRALLVGAGGETLAVPLDSIEGIVRVSPYELEEYYGDAAIDFMYAGQRYDFRYLGALINGSEPQYSSDMVGALPVLLVRAGEKLVAFQVDRLLGSREIVVKSLGPQFLNIQGVSGATVLGDG
ncbi:MAG: chemotaxis protein CheA, partial [Pseudomonadales bacterium]|nr:chemotaxis protein CheA [Pseudomonadales bacterium]